MYANEVYDTRNQMEIRSLQNGVLTSLYVVARASTLIIITNDI